VNTSKIFDSAMAGMQVAQAGMLATSQNVTGSSVDGYVRRSPDVRVNNLASSSIDLSGTSFAVEGFSRNYSSLLQKQLMIQTGRTAYTNELTRAVAGIDAMLINPDTSIASAMGNFFNAAGSLASDPTNQAFQQSLIGNAKQVVLRVRTLAEAVSLVKSDAQQGLADVLNAANTSAKQLADVNARIQSGQVPGVSYPSPDMLDERDRLVAKLHDLVGGSSLINEDGTASHQIGGLALVDRTVANRFVNQGGGSPVRADMALEGIRLQVRVGMASNSPELKEISLSQPASLDATGQVVAAFRTVFEDGKAGAYAQLITDFVPMMQRGLNLFSATLVAEVNATMPASQNRIFGFQTSTTPATDPATVKGWAGYDASASRTQFLEVLDASDPTSPASVFNTTVSDGLLNDRISALSLTVVAANNSGQFLGVGSTQAQALESLRDSFIAPLTTLTTRPATEIAGWNLDAQMNETLQTSLQNQKNSISGVNLDEEAANLVKYQQLYNASSKMIQTGQQMFDMLLSMLSGR
jgi:flagellar hook-associated protein 1 FlgK